MTYGNNLPAFVSPELGERETTWHSHGVLVLLGEGYAAQNGEEHCNHRDRRDWSFLHDLLLSYRSKWRPFSDGECLQDQVRDRIGCEINAKWLASISIVFAPIRLAMKRSRSGLIVRSWVDTA